MNLRTIVKTKIENGQYTYDSVAEYLGITKVTLYTRLAKDNWKKGEIALVMKLR